MVKQLLKIKNGSNFRHFNTYQNKNKQHIKPNKLIRSGQLGLLSNEDIVLLKENGLTYDIDFRSIQEIDKLPDKKITGVTYIKNPVFSDEVAQNAIRTLDIAKQKMTDINFGKDHLKRCYYDIVTSSHANYAYRTFFDYLLKNDKDNEALLFHCSEGKDRTGMASVFLLSALDFDIETIKADYLLTNEATTTYLNDCLKIAKDNDADDTTTQVIYDLATVNIEYLDYALDLIETQFGGMTNYLQKVLNLNTNKITKLKQLYLY